MKAVRLHEYEQRPVVEDVSEPAISGPHDVIVKIGGAGLCRTDLHIYEGQWAEKSGVKLPYTIGHENAGWVEEVGSAVTNVAPGDTVILHPLVTCGLCRACRDGDDVHCEHSAFPGIDTDGGMAEYLLTGARSTVKIDPSLQPADIAALADDRVDQLGAQTRDVAHVLDALQERRVVEPGHDGHMDAVVAREQLKPRRRPSAARGVEIQHRRSLSRDPISDLAAGQFGRDAFERSHMGRIRHRAPPGRRGREGGASSGAPSFAACFRS